MNTSQTSPAIGPLMIDIQGTQPTDEECERLAHPLVGGLILFARNYASPAQLLALTTKVHALRPARSPILIAIDHEGGRVQRCREGFTRLPPMRRLGERWDEMAETEADKKAPVLREARQVGYVLAAELRARGVDFSFAPVLDIDYGCSTVIGDRAFHRDPRVVVQLAGALIEGLRQGGMGCCGKHFPGHGGVAADSHLDTPVDERALPEIQDDLFPFRHLPLTAVMPAHVVYPEIDRQTACFSPRWHHYLRHDIGFAGAVFSDDLSMRGASRAGDMLARAEAAYRAGCDMLLICNSPEEAATVLANWKLPLDPARGTRLARLLPQGPAPAWETLAAQPEYRDAVDTVRRLCDGDSKGGAAKRSAVEKTC